MKRNKHACGTRGSWHSEETWLDIIWSLKDKQKQCSPNTQCQIPTTEAGLCVKSQRRGPRLCQIPMTAPRFVSNPNSIWLFLINLDNMVLLRCKKQFKTRVAWSAPFWPETQQHLTENGLLIARGFHFGYKKHGFTSDPVWTPQIFSQMLLCFGSKRCAPSNTRFELFLVTQKNHFVQVEQK